MATVTCARYPHCETPSFAMRNYAAPQQRNFPHCDIGVFSCGRPAWSALLLDSTVLVWRFDRRAEDNDMHKDLNPAAAPATGPAGTSLPAKLDAFWMPFTASRQFKSKPCLLAKAKDMHYWMPEG